MAKDKNKIIVYADWINRFEALTDEEAGRLIKHFFRYVNDLDPEYPDRITELSFIDIKCTLKRDLKEWERFRAKQSENGKKGGRPRKAKETQKTQPFILKPKKAVKVTVRDNVSTDVDNSDSIFSIDLCKEKYLKETKVLDSICKSQKLELKQLKTYLDRFVNHVKQTESVKSLTDFKKHFLSWLKIRMKEAPITKNGLDLSPYQGRTLKA